MEIWQKENGSTILLAILVLAVGSALVISMVQTKQNRVVSSLAQERSTRALDLAESGLETVCQQVRAWIINGEDLEEFSNNETTVIFGGGDFSVKTILLASDRLQITSQGRYQGITRVVRELVQVKPLIPPNTLLPGVTAGGDLTLNTANPGTYHGKNITLNGNKNQLDEEPITISVPTGGRITNNAGSSPLITTIYDAAPPPVVEVDMEEIEDYLKSNDQEAIINSNETWNNDIPSQYRNKPIILVKGNITINKTLKIESGLENLTIVATGNITLNGYPSVVFNQDHAEFNLISGRNLTVNGRIEPNGNDCQSLFYSEGDMVFNGHPSINNYNCQIHSRRNLTINGKARFAHEPITINIPGVAVSDQNSNGNGANQNIFTVDSWQEIDPKLFGTG